MNIFPNLEFFDVYESINQIIIIGYNNDYSISKILKLPRWTNEDKILNCNDWFLSIIEDEYIYYPETIDQVKASITGMTIGKLLHEKAHGIAGFVRFKQGYYMILITKCSRVAQLGQHKIYKVDETKMIYLPGTTTSPWDNLTKMEFSCQFPQTRHPDEKRYLALFNSVDLSIDNYFSYTYDLSNTVQYNLSFSSIKESKRIVFNSIHEQQMLVNDRFVWNWSLWPPDLRPDEKRLSSGCNWLIPLIHGYVGQSHVLAGNGCVDVIVCLIARRSRHFAGTRFMKRGSNLNGDVANEVESEQIVFENEGFTFENSKVTSIVQLRGSIPLQWHQETTKAIGKPPIEMTFEDPYNDIPGRHFSNLIYRHGTPIIILNLVKQREKHAFERPLSEKFKKSIDYLQGYFRNFNLGDEILHYLNFDMAKIQRNRRNNVLEKMIPIANECIKKTGFFYSNVLLKQLPDNERLLTKTLQYGIIRTNCIDCLDRTNTAQFVIGQTALGYQLFALGIINNISVSKIRPLDRMLQNLYENHGNVLALQYGGSVLVHNVETYRKTAKFSAQSRDFLQALSRYYNNKFSDHEKQMSINLFLGIFKPWNCKNETIWNHKNSDVFLHDSYCRTILNQFNAFSAIWLSCELIAIIPRPLVLWNKWKILNRLYEYASRTDLLQQLSKRFPELNSVCDQSFNSCNFHRMYISLFDVIFMSDVSVIDKSAFNEHENFKNHTTVFYDGCTKLERIENDLANPNDSVGTLTRGPVMTVLRNENFNETKSTSSDDFSDISDEDCLDSLKKSRQNQGYETTSFIANEEDINKNKLINFVITDYSQLSKKYADCANSSWNFYQSKDKFDINSMKVIGNYYPTSYYLNQTVEESIYQETVDFNKSGKMKKNNIIDHKEYLNCRDFPNRAIMKSRFC